MDRVVSSGASLLGLDGPVPSEGRPMCVCVLITSSYEDTSHMGLGPTLMSSF